MRGFGTVFRNLLGHILRIVQIIISGCLLRVISFWRPFGPLRHLEGRGFVIRRAAFSAAASLGGRRFRFLRSGHLAARGAAYFLIGGAGGSHGIGLMGASPIVLLSHLVAGKQYTCRCL